MKKLLIFIRLSLYQIGKKILLGLGWFILICWGAIIAIIIAISKKLSIGEGLIYIWIGLAAGITLDIILIFKLPEIKDWIRSNWKRAEEIRRYKIMKKITMPTKKEKR